MAKSIKDKVKELEKRNRLFTENIADSIFVIDAKTLIHEYVSPSTYKMSGYMPEELLNTKIIDRLPPESIKRAMELLKKGFEEYESGSHSAQAIEMKLLHKNGGTYWAEMRVKLVKESDEPLKIVGISKDITEKKNAEQQLEKQNTKLAEALAEKEKLLKEIKVLQELLPICSGCKRIRDDNGKWWPLDAYVSKHTDSDFTHTICTDCKDLFYPEKKG
jgi:PAS domain S-box-containing protein